MNKILRLALGLVHTIVESARIDGESIVVSIRPQLPGRPAKEKKAKKGAPKAA